MLPPCPLRGTLAAMRVALALFAVACSPDFVDSSEGDAAAFCSTVEEAGTWEQIVDQEVSASSGVLWVRLITDQSDDPRDPYYVAYRAYALEPAETGGVQTTGSTTGDGIIEKTLGVGNWAVEATWTRGSTTCTAEATLPVDEQTMTRGCILLTCPE